MKILLVDDNEDIRKMLRRKFKKTRWEIIEAVNGLEGVELAFQHQPDLILMDMHMPVLDGHEATKRLKEQGYTGKIAALTASVMRTHSHEALENGCDYFIAKPITKDFIEQIRKILE